MQRDIDRVSSELRYRRDVRRTHEARSLREGFKYCVPGARPPNVGGVSQDSPPTRLPVERDSVLALFHVAPANVESCALSGARKYQSRIRASHQPERAAYSIQRVLGFHLPRVMQCD